MSRELPKVLALGLAVLVVVALGIVWAPRLLGRVAGPDTDIITHVKEVERDGVELALGPSATLKGKKLSYQRMTVTPDESGTKATLLATLDFTGSLGATEVSSLGVEKVVFVKDNTDWKPEGTVCPRLVGVVRALEARRQAFNAGDKNALLRLSHDAPLGAEAEAWLALHERKLQVDAWFIRLERDEVTVSEQYRLDGFGKDRPFRAAGPRRLTLRAAEGEFFFPNGPM